MITNDAFIRDLLKAANEVEHTGQDECKRLLHRAAWVVRDIREDLPFHKIRRDDDAPDPVEVWLSAGDEPQDAERVKAAMLDAVDVIRIAERLVALRRTRGNGGEV